MGGQSGYSGVNGVYKWKPLTLLWPRKNAAKSFKIVVRQKRNQNPRQNRECCGDAKNILLFAKKIARNRTYRNRTQWLLICPHQCELAAKMCAISLVLWLKKFVQKKWKSSFFVRIPVFTMQHYEWWIHSELLRQFAPNPVWCEQDLTKVHSFHHENSHLKTWKTNRDQFQGLCAKLMDQNCSVPFTQEAENLANDRAHCCEHAMECSHCHTPVNLLCILCEWGPRSTVREKIRQFLQVNASGKTPTLTLI